MLGFLYLLLSCVLVGADYYLKQWASTTLKPVTQIDIIPDVLSLYYHQNFGAAFGILQQRRFLLVTVTAVVLLVLVIAMLLSKVRGHMLLLSFSLIIGGGVGNLIDRMLLGYVVDYIYFEPINFPIFNLADCCVVVGTALFAIYILFLDGKGKATTQAQPLPPDTAKDVHNSGEDA